MRSAQKLEQHLKQSNIPGMETCLKLWPRTPKSQLLRLGVEQIQQFLFAEEVVAGADCEKWFAHYFQYCKVSSDFTNSQKLQKYIYDNHIYPSWDIFGAATGRIITRKPAINSTPRAAVFRNMFRALEHHDFIICDYSMIEIVIIAVISNDQTMLQNLYDHKDLHIFLAAQVLNKPYEQLMALKQTNPSEYKKIRNPMKAVNFGLLYGMGVETLWKRFISLGYNYTKEEVRHIHKVWTDTYSGIARYKILCQQQIQMQIPSALYVPNSCNAITSVRGRVAQQTDAMTSTYNFPIQATCADILKTALRIFMLAKQKHLFCEDILVILTAHDEIVFQCPQEKTEITKQQVQLILLEAAHKILKPIQPLISCGVEIGVGQSWADKP
nr:DNA polymerase I [Halimeda borneensis]